MRCVCGYGEEWHPGGRCPLCACGAAPAEHLPTAVSPSPLCGFRGWPHDTWDGKTIAVCPGKPRTKAGALPTLRRGEFRPAPPAEPFRARPTLPLQPAVAVDPLTTLRAADLGLPPAETHPDPPLVAFPLASEAPLAPLVEQVGPQEPARFTQSLDEIAPAAMRLGKVAAAAGWVVDPWYWITAEGVEVSALVMQRDELRSFATWEKAPGGPWRSKAALGWRSGMLPVPLGVKALTASIAELG